MVDILPDQETKVKWLLTRLVEFQAGILLPADAHGPIISLCCAVAGSVLIFATRKTEADYLYKDLTSKGQEGIVAPSLPSTIPSHGDGSSFTASR